ncbi:hypothetical protein GTQ43_31435 [Nostoc sp. KVJ3]|nr:hypothetical protein [Nostoc sp. KVJ3]
MHLFKHLLHLCIDVAMPAAVNNALNQPLDLISTEMVFRSLYHFSQAVLRGDASDSESETFCQKVQA